MRNEIEIIIIFLESPQLSNIDVGNGSDQRV